MKAIVDAEQCSGCGACADVCPNVFEMDEAGDKAVVKVDTVPANLEDDCRDAAEGCPEEAIRLEE